MLHKVHNSDWFCSRSFVSVRRTKRQTFLHFQSRLVCHPSSILRLSQMAQLMPSPFILDGPFGWIGLFHLSVPESPHPSDGEGRKSGSVEKWASRSN
jgi:hypothetical protein